MSLRYMKLEVYSSTAFNRPQVNRAQHLLRITMSASNASDYSSSNSFCTSKDMMGKSEQQASVDEIRQKTLINISDEQPSLSISGVKRDLEAQDVLNWDDRRGYMRVKKQKLEEQFHGMAGQKESTIFQGVTIHVNGWTEPSNDELKRMIHAHGGNYVVNLYGNTKVTHTIATNLPNFKIKTLGDSIVCSPAWIVDSITAGQQLPTDGYLLYSHHSSQKKLTFSKTIKENHINKKETLLSNNHHISAGVEEFRQEICTHISTADSDNKESAAVACDDTCSIKAVEHSPTSSRKTKAYNPTKGAEFVNEFFTHSRLHYLSTWSTELKQFTARMVNHIQPKYPKLHPSHSLRGQRQRAVVHIDLDCFFVSVSIRDKPHLKGKPVAVTHAKVHDDRTTQSLSSQGSSPVKQLQDSTSDIASCSYEARKAGLHNGMSVGKAVKLCPNLELLPYDFDGYRQVSQLFYETLLLYSSTVEAVSCDEAYLELTDYAEDFVWVEAVISELRQEVESKTGCTVSAGISHNMLLARLSTRTAKPNGQFYLSFDQTESFLASLSVHDLPGVGYSTTKKLKAMGIESCGELRALTLAKLQKDFGLKNGTMLYEFCRGIDSRDLKLSSERKSVSVDINYGIRFKDISEAESLIKNLAVELEKRAKEAEVVGGNVTLKMKVRKPDVPHETWKYLGHGACDNVSRSTLLLQPTQEAKEIGQFAVKLLRQVRVVASDIRGMGLQLSKLVSESGGGASSATKEGANLRTMFQAASTSSAPRAKPIQRMDMAPLGPPLPKLVTETIDRTLPDAYLQSEHHTNENSLPGEYSLPSVGASLTKQASTDDSFLIDLPPMSQLDCSVLDALPSSLRNQILRSYEKSVKSEGTQLHKLVEREQQEIITLLTSTSDSNTPEPATLFSSDLLSNHHTLAIEATCYRQSETDSDRNVQQVSDVESELVIDNEEEFLKEFRKYIREWIANSSEGPKESDALKFTDFLASFTRTNLEVTQIVLRFFRRLIVQLDSKGWAVYFNTLLVKVQDVTRQFSGGTLKISELDL